jgi:hypothetical protein
MRRLLTLTVLASVLFIVAPQALDAQIPNPSFETWTTAVPGVPTMPTGWTTGFFGITKSSTAHTGSAAVQGLTQDFGLGNIIPASITCWFPTNQRHAKLQGWYQLNSVGNDELVVALILYKNKFPVAAGESTFVGTGSGYVQFTVNIDQDYISGDVPDTGYVLITSDGPGSVAPHAGTTWLVDDVSLSGLVNSVQTISTAPSTFALEQNYPNPFNPSTTIRFSIASESPVQLSVFNLIGQEVARPLDERKSAGVYAVQFDASSLPTGTYVYRLRAGDYTMARTMTLVR